MQSSSSRTRWIEEELIEEKKEEEMEERSFFTPPPPPHPYLRVCRSPFSSVAFFFFPPLLSLRLSSSSPVSSPSPVLLNSRPSYLSTSLVGG